MTLDFLALVDKGTCNLGSHGAITIREIVLGMIPLTGLCIDSILKHTPSLFVKEVYLLVLEHWPEGRHQVWHTSRDLWTCYQRNISQCTLALCSPSVSLQLACISQTEAYTFVWRPEFCSCFPGDTFRSPGTGGQWDWHLQSIGLYTFAYSRSCYWRVWLPISLNIGADWGPPLWSTEVSSYSQLLETIKNKISCLNNHKGLRDSQELGQGWTIRVISYMKSLTEDWERWLFYLMSRY